MPRVRVRVRVRVMAPMPGSSAEHRTAEETGSQGRGGGGGGGQQAGQRRAGEVQGPMRCTVVHDARVGGEEAREALEPGRVPRRDDLFSAPQPLVVLGVREGRAGRLLPVVANAIARTRLHLLSVGTRALQQQSRAERQPEAHHPSQLCGSK
jgi:hypothetical protein